MPKPWEKYNAPGPWAKYSQPEQQRISEKPVGRITEESTSVLTGQPVSQREMLGDNIGIESGAEMVGNIPESGAKFIGDIYNAVRHPIETAKSLGELSLGIVEKMVPGKQEHEEAANAVGAFLKDRYGSVDKIKKTAKEDPVGFVSDLAGVFMVGGAAMKASKVPGLVNAGKTVQQAGASIEPLNMIKKGVVKPLAKAIPEETPIGMYESSAKFSTTIPAAERKQMAKTAVESGIMPTQKGVDKARAMINTLNDHISGMIDNATSQGKKIDADSVLKYLDDIKKETYLSDDPTRNLKAIERIEKSIKTGIKEVGDGGLTPKQAQQLKKRIYNSVNFANRPRSPQYAEVAKKSVARAAKEELENIYPELKTLNAKEGALIKLLESIERSAARIGNRDLVGIGLPIKGTTGGVVAGGPGAAAGIIGGILDTPTVKARLAIALEKARKADLPVSTKGAGSRLAAQQSGRLESLEE